MKTKLEYIWLDGYFPTQNMRSKTKVVEGFSGKFEDCPMWSFDGSSTKQATGGSSDCLLKPVAIFPDPERVNAFLVFMVVSCFGFRVLPVNTGSSGILSKRCATIIMLIFQ